MTSLHGSSIPPPTVPVPIAADLGGPVVLPVMMCVYPSACYAEDKRSERVKGLSRETKKKRGRYRGSGTYIRMGTYIT